MGSLSSPLLACIVFCIPDTCRLKSIKVENHKKLWNRLLSISDTCQLISIEFDRQWSTFIDFRNYRHVTSCYLWAHSSLSVLSNSPCKKEATTQQGMQKGANFYTTLLLLYHTSDWLNQQNLPKLQVAVYLFILHWSTNYFHFNKISSESKYHSNPMWGTLENWKLLLSLFTTVVIDFSLTTATL